MTEALAAHLRANWSYDGLEVTGRSPVAVQVTVGPTFPISELCMDVCDPDTFDAIVTMTNSMDGVQLVLEPKTTPSPKLFAWPIVLTAVGAAISLAAPTLIKLYPRLVNSTIE